MAQKELNEILEFFKKNKKYLKEEFGVIQIGIFGSIVMGEVTKKSDIDIVIEMESDKKNLHNFLKLKRMLRRELRRKIDLGLKSAIKPNVYEKIKDRIIYV